MVENKAEVLFCVGKEQTFVATTIAVHNPFEFQKRDVGKPSQRKIFAISPRLARIMTNLAALRQGQVLLDPFCGVGTILQEALLAGAEVVGMDINNWCVEAATRNLNWLKNEYSLEDAKYRVVQGDILKLTEKIGREQVDCIVTEPDLGPALRQIPTKPYALRLIEKLKPLHYSFLEEAFRVLRKDGRLVTVSPYIRTRSEQPVAMQISNKAAEIGYRTASIFREEFFTEKENLPQNLIGITSLIDTDERHKIGREVHVFQK
jgi:tRNA G10  N-methylase Trm11